MNALNDALELYEHGDTQLALDAISAAGFWFMVSLGPECLWYTIRLTDKATGTRFYGRGLEMIDALRRAVRRAGAPRP